MSDATLPLPTTLDECHTQLKQLAADNAALQAVNTRQRAAIDEQRATIDEQQATIDEQQAAIESMQRDLALMKRALFGQRRERFDDPRQGLLFDSVEIGEPGQGGNGQSDGTDESDTPNEDKSPSRRRGRVRRVIPEGLPREQRVHKLADADIPEHLRGDGVRRFLKKVGEWVEWERPRLTVIEEYVETLAIDNTDATQTTMLSAVRPPRILNCFAGPSLLAG